MNQSIAVAGLGRCGTSLVLQMLSKGGIPVLGEFPAYEPLEVGIIDRNLPALFRCGKAFKFLDPHRDESFPWARTLKVIWLDRDYEEQAKSQIKMVEILGRIVVPQKRKAVRRMEKQLKLDRNASLVRLEDSGADIFEMQFEAILANPYTAARDIHSFLRIAFDEDAATASVIQRHPACRPDMSLEFMLIEREESKKASNPGAPAPARPGGVRA